MTDTVSDQAIVGAYLWFIGVVTFFFIAWELEGHQFSKRRILVASLLWPVTLLLMAWHARRRRAR